MKEIKFVSTIGRLGMDRLIINIPKKYHEEVKEMFQTGDSDEDHDEVVVTVKRLDYSKI